jgi:threonine aldolase
MSAESFDRPPARRHFASDNNAGIHPLVLAAIAAANDGHVAGYGDDPYTQRAEAAFRALLGAQARVFFTFNGTGANVVALAAAMRPYEAVICPAGAHLNVDECGAFERFAGAKLIDVAVEDGKLTPQHVEAALTGLGDPHHVQPAAISISQATEVGTVYTLGELRSLGEAAHRHGLLFHVDGARLANAAAALGVELRTLLVESGIDVATFGGTKNGLAFGEAIVLPRPHALCEALPFVRKQGAQLASKMRFIAAQFEALLHQDLWLQNAQHANAMAQLLASRTAALGVPLAYPVQSNAVFAILPREAIEPLQRERWFYEWDAKRCIVRWMTAFDTTEDDVHAFADAVAKVVRTTPPLPEQRAPA